MSHNQTTDPASLPITLQQVKAWTRIDDNASDAELAGLMQAATKRAEVIMDRPIIQREYTLTLDDLPTAISLPGTPAQSVTSITYIDTDGTLQTLASNQYQVDLGGEYKHGRIVPAYGITWPAVRKIPETITVVYQAGYGPDWNSVPADIQQAIAYMVGHYYDMRDIVGENKTVPETAIDILMGHRVYTV